MSSIQERLQLKRVPLDTWNIREQLCLASAVVRSGDQNWMSVSRALKTVGEPNRPVDWYSQKSCAAQYGALLENVETPKRKKRNSEGGVETPQESILKKLTQERIAEIQKTLAEMNQQYEQIMGEVTELRNPSTSDDRVRELWTGVEAAKRTREREAARRAAWLREREEKRVRAERGWRPSQANTSPNSAASPSPQPSSPLLTSLLKSSPVVTTPQHISHPANVVDTVSPSANAPTLSLLLEKPGQRESASAAIEHIKSQLVQIEQQLKANTTAAPSVPLAPVSTPAVDIDDIEIKAEDVYAFSDIDLVIAPVASIHKANNRIDKPVYKQDEELAMSGTEDNEVIQQTKSEEIIPFQPALEVVNVEQTRPEPVMPVPQESDTPQLITEPETNLAFPDVKLVFPEVKLAFPEVKFPTTEIKVIPSDEQLKIKEEIKEVEVTQPETETAEAVEASVEVPALPPIEDVTCEDSLQPTTDSEPSVDDVLLVPTEVSQLEQTIKPENIPLPPPAVPPDSQPDLSPTSEPDFPPTSEPDLLPTSEPHLPPTSEPDLPPISQPDSPPALLTALPPASPPDLPPALLPVLPPDLPHVNSTVNEEKRVENEPEPPPQELEMHIKDETEAELLIKEKEPEVAEVAEPDVAQEVPTVPDVKSEDQIKEDVEGSIPIKEMIAEEVASTDVPDADVKEETAPEADAETEEVHTETDDDTPMELSREEEKDGKKKRDYSRKKKPDSRTCSGSESAEASAPESPSGAGGASEVERQHRLWKKSVMLVFSRLCAHKYASLFLRPISDEEAPGYSVVIKRPMDLSTIKKNIEAGIVRTTSEFQRDVLLMLCNALMYNSSEHSVYRMALEMHEEAVCQLSMLLAAQAHAGLAPPARLTRKRRTEHANTHSEHSKRPHT